MLIPFSLWVAPLVGKAPQLERPYRTFGYPLAPVIYILLASLLVVDLAYLAPQTSGIGYLLVLTGLPVYLIWRMIAGWNAARELKDNDDIKTNGTP